MLTDLMELHIVELTKELKEGNPLNDWISKMPLHAKRRQGRKGGML